MGIELEDTFQGKRLDQMIKHRMMTKKELADAIDVSPSAVGKWIKGTLTPGHSSVEKLCDFFEVPPRYFYIKAHEVGAVHF